MFVLQILFAIRKINRALKKTGIVKDVVGEVMDPRTTVAEEVIRNASAYAYEIGRGQPMNQTIHASFDNPFLDKDWRKKVALDG